MKGVIVNCLEELVTEKFGKEKWQESLEKAGLDKGTIFFRLQDVEDEAALQVVDSVCQVLNISLTAAADAFGDYWINVFAPRSYSAYYRGVESAKDFLLKTDYFHEAATQTTTGAHPPRFEYEWKDDKTLIMKYISHRGLIDFMVGLIKGVGKYYNEELTVTKIGEDKVEIAFP